MTTEKPLIILDTDIGVDDAIALRYALLCTKVLGVSCTYGNVAVEQVVKNAKLLCDHYGCSPQILRGASRPFNRVIEHYSTHIHGKDGMGGVFDNHFSPEAPDAINFIIESARRMPGEITLCTIGPLTNLAMALILEPNLPNLLKQVVMMGGAFGTHGHSGNMSQFAEFNVHCDPQACEIVFASDLKLTVIPLDVTHQVLLDEQELNGLNDEFIAKISAFYLNFARQTEKFSGICVHDAMTIAYLMMPECFSVKEVPLSVSLSGLTLGQTLMPQTDFAVAYNCFAHRPVHQVCLGVESAKVKAHLIDTLSLK